MAEVGYVDEDTQPFDVLAEEREDPGVDPQPEVEPESVPETPEVEPAEPVPDEGDKDDGEDAS